MLEGHEGRVCCLGPTDGIEWTYLHHADDWAQGWPVTRRLFNGVCKLPIKPYCDIVM